MVHKSPYTFLRSEKKHILVFVQPINISQPNQTQAIDFENFLSNQFLLSLRTEYAQYYIYEEDKYIFSL